MKLLAFSLPYIFFDIKQCLPIYLAKKKKGRGFVASQLEYVHVYCMKELRGLQTVTRHDKGGGSGGRSDLFENHCIIFIMKFPILPY